MKANRNLVTAAIGAERAYQDAKWGTPKDHPHEIPGWLLIMRKELEEAEEAWIKGVDNRAALCEILQVVATGFACLQQYGPVTRSDMSGK